MVVFVGDSDRDFLYTIFSFINLMRIDSPVGRRYDSRGSFLIFQVTSFIVLPESYSVIDKRVC